VSGVVLIPTLVEWVTSGDRERVTA